MTKQEEFQKAIEENNIKLVCELVQEGKIDPENNGNEALRTAAKYGFVDIVELLFKVGVKPVFGGNCTIRIAAFYGNIKLIEFLLKESRVDPSDCGNESICFAYKKKYTDIVELLWSSQTVKDTLKYDNTKIYNELVQQDIKNKVSQF
jgi:ankyrin repeat protein